jgi:hypothetical protein
MGAGDGNFYMCYDNTAARHNLTVSAAGNITINGTADAGFRLDVNGTGRFSGAYSTNPGLTISGTTYGYLTTNRGSTSASAGVSYNSVGSLKWFVGITENTDNFQFYSLTTNNFPLILAASTGAATFSSDVTATRYLNPGGPYGTGAANARNHFTQFNAGNAGLAGGWISAAFGDALGNRIVIGQYQGIAAIAGHSANLDAWASMALATGGGNVMIGTITDNGQKLQVVGGSLRVQGTNANSRTILYDNYSSGAVGMQMFNNSGVSVIDLNANVGAATFVGSVTASSFFEVSDATIKRLVQDNYQAKGIDSVVAKLYIKNGKQELGYFAQDLEGVLPSAVNKGSDGLLNLSYREVHTAKIAYLEEEIRQIKKRYEIN